MGVIKKYVINNAIALGIHVLVAAVVLGLGFSLDSEIIALILGCMLYVIGGLFLKPARKYAILSVISVFALLVIMFLCCIVLYPYIEDSILYLYVIVNPILFPLLAVEEILDIDYFAWNTFGISLDTNPVWVLSSLVLPSLLMYLGMVLRKRFKRFLRIRSSMR